MLLPPRLLASNGCCFPLPAALTAAAGSSSLLWVVRALPQNFGQGIAQAVLLPGGVGSSTTYICYEALLTKQYMDHELWCNLASAYTTPALASSICHYRCIPLPGLLPGLGTCRGWDSQVLVTGMRPCLVTSVAVADCGCLCENQPLPSAAADCRWHRLFYRLMSESRYETMLPYNNSGGATAASYLHQRSPRFAQRHCQSVNYTETGIGLWRKPRPPVHWFTVNPGPVMVPWQQVPIQFVQGNQFLFHPRAAVLDVISTANA